MLQDLNDSQKKAVGHVQGPLLVLAGAGVGKTRVVTFRIAKLLEMGIFPSQILAVTFTNKAADEMRSRVQSLTQKNVLTCTFHSLGVRILKESITTLGYQENFTIYDEQDSLELLKNCLLEKNLWMEEKGFLKAIQAKISDAKNNLIDPEKVCFPPKDIQDTNERVFLQIFPFYQQKLKEYNAVDFDDLLFLPVKIIQQFPDLKERYQDRWKYLLVDEYQDTNFAQYTLVKILGEKNQNICVVGDPDQSIYAWRGALYKNILNFDKDFPKATVISLEQNYRSTNTILNAANSLIQHNIRQYDKKLWSQLEEGNKVIKFIADSDREEAEFVIQKVLAFHQKNLIPLKDIAIFYRTNSQSRLFEDLLLQKKVPYIIFGGLSFYQRREIKDLLSFLKLCLFDADFLSFCRAINIPKKGIGNSTLQKLNLFAEQQKMPILQALIPLCNSSTIENLKLSEKQKIGIKNFLNLIFSLRVFMQNHSLPELISETIERTGYLSYLKEDPLSFDDRKANIEEFLVKAYQWQEEKKSSHLIQFLEDLSLFSALDVSRNIEGVQLMTLHNSKGLEFSVVFIVGMEEDLFPLTHSQGRDLEEERRLCYVGMTRAKKHLHLSCSRLRFLWGNLREMIPSRFIQEIAKEYVQNVSPYPSDEEEEEKEEDDDGNVVVIEENITERNVREKNFIKRNVTKENGTEEKFRERNVREKKGIEENVTEKKQFSFFVGDKVFHSTLGKGIVKKCYQTSMGETFDVFFEKDKALYSLVGKYAKLSSAT
jgi:DNA helicase-2/ATP-dependent DNA helicase PcrA